MKIERYFMVRPSDFYRLGPIDEYGNCYKIQCNDFLEVDELYNVLIFEMVAIKDKLYYFREFFTKKEFDARIFFTTVDDEETYMAKRIESKKLGLFTNKSFRTEEVSPIEASGLLSSLRRDRNQLQIYSQSLKSMFDTAKSYKDDYDKNVDGPSRELSRSLRKSFRKMK